MKTGIELIMVERAEQIFKHKRSQALDKRDNDKGQLLEAAINLAMDWSTYAKNTDGEISCPEGWDKKIWMKMLRKAKLKRLVIAGALIAAEIDRLQKTPYKAWGAMVGAQ